MIYIAQPPLYEVRAKGKKKSDFVLTENEMRKRLMRRGLEGKELIIRNNGKKKKLADKELEKLKLAHREVLTLHFLEGFSIQEMARIIGVSEGTVKSRIYYAKNKLYKALKGANHV